MVEARYDLFGKLATLLTSMGVIGGGGGLRRVQLRNVRLAGARVARTALNSVLPLYSQMQIQAIPVQSDRAENTTKTRRKP